MGLDFEDFSTVISGALGLYNGGGGGGGKKAPSGASRSKAWTERSMLSDIARRPASEFPLQKIPGLTDTEQQAQTILAKLLSGGMFQDPRSSPLYQGFRQESMGEEEKAAGEMRRFAQLGGMGQSTPAFETEGRLRQDFAGQRLGLLGQLYEKERDRDNPYTRLSAVQQYGGLPREVEQQQGLAQYNQSMQQLMFPYTTQADLLQRIIGNEVWKGKKPGSNTMGNIGAGLGAAASIAQIIALSDRRLKTNIEYYPINVLPGVKLASWTWNDKANDLGLFGNSRGVIAQDLERVAPDLVVTGDDGYKRVRYGRLLLEIAA